MNKNQQESQPVELHINNKVVTLTANVLNITGLGDDEWTYHGVVNFRGGTYRVSRPKNKTVWTN